MWREKVRRQHSGGEESECDDQVFRNFERRPTLARGDVTQTGKKNEFPVT